MTTYKTAEASIRVDGDNPAHHLFQNNGEVWWVYYQSFPNPVQEQRIRRSLGTKDLKEAVARRDALFAKLFPGYRSEG